MANGSAYQVLGKEVSKKSVAQGLDELPMAPHVKAPKGWQNWCSLSFTTYPTYVSLVLDSSSATAFTSSL